MLFSNLYLGVDYMVYNQNQSLTKECYDMNQLSLNSIYCSTCSICGFRSYKFFQASNSVTGNYYSIDLVGLVNSNETQIISWLTNGIYNAWVDENTGLFEIYKELNV
jgi:hypothetical protein